jgi:uncharacterized iron-regulated membrane protein
MRKYHRWLSVLFGVFILWIGTTGVMIQLADLTAQSEPPSAHSAIPAGFTCPPDMTCRVKPAPGGAKAWSGFIKELHSGEEFGPLGTALSIMSGLALMFFAFSGLWMYIQMFRNRAPRSLKPGWFWQ